MKKNTMKTNKLCMKCRQACKQLSWVKVVDCKKYAYLPAITCRSAS